VLVARAQGGLTLDPEQGELDADFCHLGIAMKILASLISRRQADYALLVEAKPGCTEKYYIIMFFLAASPCITDLCLSLSLELGKVASPS
jgi:hypothetical protein